jgi:hypothetical protein
MEVTRTVLERMDNGMLKGTDVYYAWEITDELSGYPPRRRKEEKEEKRKA